MPDWVKLYHHLPYPLRVLAVSARGYYLRWWRYGPDGKYVSARGHSRVACMLV
jgi:hypothetical protein